MKIVVRTHNFHHRTMSGDFRECRAFRFIRKVVSLAVEFQLSSVCHCAHAAPVIRVRMPAECRVGSHGLPDAMLFPQHSLEEAECEC